MLQTIRKTAATFAIAALLGAPLAAQTSDSGKSNDTADRYKYTLTPEAAHECGVLQLMLSKAKKDTDPLWSRRHQAMSFTWFTTIGLLQEEPISKDQADQFIKSTQAKFPGGKFSLDRAIDLAKPCEVMKALYSEKYRYAVEIAEKEKPDLYADNAARKRQIGGEYPDAPTKEKLFGKWFFFAKGNLCFAASTDTSKGTLTLGFINFFDGSLKLEWEGLPELTEDNYETEIVKHQAGIGWSEDEDVLLPVLDEGVTYKSFKGTALFVDEKPVAMLNGDYMSMGTKYIFGAHIQRPYYNLMPAGKKLTIKVLGKETHSFNIDKPDMWNEISECMAQYPFG